MQTVYESPDQRDIPSSMCEEKKNETVIFPVIFQNILSRMTWNGNGTIDSLNF